MNPWAIAGAAVGGFVAGGFAAEVLGPVVGAGIAPTALEVGPVAFAGGLTITIGTLVGDLIDIGVGALENFAGASSQPDALPIDVPSFGSDGMLTAF